MFSGIAARNSGKLILSDLASCSTSALDPTRSIILLEGLCEPSGLSLPSLSPLLCVRGDR